MQTKIGLPENRKRLLGAGLQKAQNSKFDDGYDAGFKAGLKYNKENLIKSIHQLGIDSIHYDGLNALVHSYKVIQLIEGDMMPTPDGVLTTSKIWSEPAVEVVIDEEQEDDLPKL